MPKTKIGLLSLITLCMTLIILTWMLKGALCGFEFHGGKFLTLVFTLAYESK
ncbi:hypothetical protein VII00023_09344 [Vibrio ichthyoenteri ATCC 700023]|uniref:Hok/gef family protein n=1 Tax=Vibrio ichthyoenteri ATCC 700023 TaxID=870968 RepID=F9S208_9VIBR|nr:hypothetical protein VII00023_09344 [Vibrio ichthyoenteri ATCC 700023]